MVKVAMESMIHLYLYLHRFGADSTVATISCRMVDWQLGAKMTVEYNP